MTIHAPELTQSEIEKRNKLRREKPLVYNKIMKFGEKVGKGESIAILQFQYDYRCNFRCRHCCISKMEKKKRHFTVADVKELSRQADEMGLANIVVTGGEPLLFPEFDDIIRAIDPQKFYITSDTNGWYLDEAKAKHLKSIGVDKIQLSIDNLSAADHDDFRRKPGSHERTLKAIDAAQAAELNIIIATVVTKQRIRSQEFEDFLSFMNGKGVGVFVSYAKPVGEWEGKYDVLINKDDMDYLRELEKKYNVFSHLTPSYGLNLGCIAVKRMVSITMYGDIMPCPYIHVSLGNFFEEPLKDIINRGMKMKYFAKHIDTCLIAEDLEFIEEYEAKRIYGKPLPVPYKEVFKEEDFM
jgi:MoaA/NifB/PqqE/SkfB family radical SAM enzyme